MERSLNYSASELVALRLPGFPTSKSKMIARAERENWSFQEKNGRGGLRREYQIPQDARVALLERATASSELVAAVPISAIALSDKQKLAESARRAVLTALERLQGASGVSRESAMITLLTHARSGQVQPQLDAALRLARDPRGRKGDSYPSVRSLKRWLAQERTGSLAPKVTQSDMSVPAWVRPFMALYQQPQKPSVELAYRGLVQSYVGDLPTLHQVRRFLGKMGKVSREVGRMGPRELKNIRPFIRRTFEQLQPNDVWTADGHTFDAEVQHPLHGRPFRPEITSILDIATRRAVGFSIGLAESSLAVLEAISTSALKCGGPAIFYVDNGSGYDNQLLKREGTGLKGLLGFEVSHSLPYNSQAKGVIERSHKTIWIDGAKQLKSFVGASMDREARLSQFKLTRNAVKKGGVMPLIGWEDFTQFALGLVADYNDRPHRALPKIKDAKTGKRRHMTPNECWQSHCEKGWEPMTLTESEAQNIFRPRQQRKVARGEISLFNNRYYSGLLEEFHGEDVHVGFDINDASKVWVYTLDGRFICTAEYGANERHYFPMSYVEQGREKRADARIKRLDVHRDEIEAERRGREAIDIAPSDTLTIPGFGSLSRAALADRVIEIRADDISDVPLISVASHEPIVETAQVFVLPETAEQRFAKWQALDAIASEGGTIETADDRRWHSLYAKSKEFAAQMRRKQDAGELPLASYN